MIEDKIPRVRLEPISSDDYCAWRDAAVVSYAADKVRSGNWPEDDALERSAASFKELLPEGPDTPGNRIFSIVDEVQNDRVGVVWVNTVAVETTSSAFIYDLIIFPEYRRRGYGESALYTLEAKLKEEGIAVLSLHVFGYNNPAIALYQKVGFLPTNINMSKRLSEK